MARARNIKPSFFQNEELGELNPIDRLAFIGMWTVADFKGCIEFRPKRLKVQLLPYDDCDFELIAKNLDKSGFIKIYTVAGQRYLKIINFEKHQNPHKNERESGSDIPDLSDDAVIEDFQINPEQDGTTPADSPIPLPETNVKALSGKPDIKADAIEILEYLNVKADRKFKAVKANLSMIEARLKDFTKNELIAVVDDRCLAWAKDEKMVSYLRPETLFNATKCAGYVGNLGLQEVIVVGQPWYITVTGIENKAKELAIIQRKDEAFPYFKERVYKAAGITDDMVRVAKQDYGNKKVA